ncbi:MAG: class I adenylate-forming enzyme family protein [Lachnospiraceae bacterium]|jgi:long-chain acyl-CoA synthetase|nr:class I adenylate-forming enzyme family protein [Lachnospiraceae bacterium]MEE3460976.1 class I adenylate-forming enzyme family protein [Lachnospiraceae bacterium]
MSRTYDDTMFKDTFEHEYTWLNGFMRNVRRFHDRPAVIDPKRGINLTYKELNRDANRLAHALRDDGLGKDDIVMTALRNSPEFAVSYVGPRKIGSILLAANYNLASGEMAKLIDFNKPKVFIYSANVADMAKEAIDLCHYKPIRVVLADNIEGKPVPEGHISYEEYTGEQDETDPEMDFRPHIYDEVVRLCTSGTTALPKSVPISDINEVLSAHDVIMQFSLVPRDATLNTTPWFHRGGVHIGGCCPTFYVGGTCVIMRDFNAKAALKWVKEYGVTHIIGAPASLEMLYRTKIQSKIDTSGIKAIITMGAPLDKAACIRYQEYLTPNIFNGYGTTEMFVNSYLRPYDLPDGAGSVGNSAIDDEVRVVKIYDGKKAEPDELVPCDSKTEGEVITFAPQKTTYSYYNNDEMTKEKFYKGWMYTGDTAVWDENWKVTIMGRKDDMVVVSGENIYPQQIEEAILEDKRVKDCIVTSLPDKIRGHVIAAYVVPEDRSLTVQDVFEFCGKSKDISKYKMPRYVGIIDEIPRTATGKKMHNVMKKRAPEDLKSNILRRS